MKRHAKTNTKEKHEKNEKNKKYRSEYWFDDDDDGKIYSSEEEEMKLSNLKEEEIGTFFKRDMIIDDKKINIDEKISERISNIYAKPTKKEEDFEKEEQSLKWIRVKKKKEEHFHTATMDVMKPTNDLLKKQKFTIPLSFLEKEHQVELMKMDEYNLFELYFLKTKNESKFGSSPSIFNLILDFKKIRGKHPFQISFVQNSVQDKNSEKISHIADLIYICDTFHFYFLQIQFEIFIDKKVKLHPILLSQLYNWEDISFLDKEDPLRVKMDSFIHLKAKYIQHYYFHCKCVGY